MRCWSRFAQRSHLGLVKPRRTYDQSCKLISPSVRGLCTGSTQRSEENERTENIATVPNLLSAARMVAAPCVGYLIVNGQHTEAFWLLGAASFTDAIDGYIARNVPGQMSKFGAVLDPLADKALMVITSVSLGYAGLMPQWLVAGLIGRDVALMLGGFYLRYDSLPEPKTFARYWDGRIVSAQVTPTDISKAHTVLSLAVMGASLSAPVFGVPSQAPLTGLFYLTGATTVLSGISYVTSKTAVQYVK